MKKMWRYVVGGLLLWALCACASFPDAPPRTQAPVIIKDEIASIDGARLGLTAWEAEEPVAIVVAVHGMNDYANTFALAGEWWAREASLTTYAYDQRGFGRSPDVGRWAGAPTMRKDFLAVVEAVRAKHPEKPIYVLGHSMGAAVILSALREAPMSINGAILAAPGVWGGSQMPILYRMSANLAAIFAPGKTLTGERASRQATDNIPILRAMQADPYVIKETRVDSVLGVTRIMGEAYDASDEAGGAILFLYGEKDEIIPIKSMVKTSTRLCGDVETRTYKNGWHLLFRDLQAKNVWRDVAAWIGEKNTADPSMNVGPAAFSCTDEGSAR